MTPILTWTLLCLSAFAAGIVNSLAGGGTLLTFSSLLTTTQTSLLANTTSTVALVPGSMAGAWGYRRDLRGMGSWLWLLVLPSLLGGLIGALLLTKPRDSDRYFELVIPWLLLLAVMLFLLQPALTCWLGYTGESPTPSSWLRLLIVIFQFFVAVYGGYFGAGIGVLMLSSLGLMGIGDIYRMNGVKTVLAACINGVSVIVFVWEGKVEWRYALPMALTAIVGGYFGARVGRLLPRSLVRWLVILVGFGLAAYYFAKQVGLLAS
jgi:uncharacterized membrane protein YfcA